MQYNHFIFLDVGSSPIPFFTFLSPFFIYWVPISQHDVILIFFSFNKVCVIFKRCMRVKNLHIVYPFRIERALLVMIYFYIVTRAYCLFAWFVFERIPPFAI